MTFGQLDEVEIPTQILPFGAEVALHHFGCGYVEAHIESKAYGGDKTF